MALGNTALSVQVWLCETPVCKVCGGDEQGRGCS